MARVALYWIVLSVLLGLLVGRFLAKVSSFDRLGHKARSEKATEQMSGRVPIATRNPLGGPDMAPATRSTPSDERWAVLEARVNELEEQVAELMTLPTPELRKVPDQLNSINARLQRREGA